MIFDLITLFGGLSIVLAVIGLTQGFRITYGGLIGEPNHEVIIEPKNEPIPMTAPLPVADPFQEIVEQPDAA